MASSIRVLAVPQYASEQDVASSLPAFCRVRSCVIMVDPSAPRGSRTSAVVKLGSAADAQAVLRELPNQSVHIRGYDCRVRLEDPGGDAVAAAFAAESGAAAVRPATQARAVKTVASFNSPAMRRVQSIRGGAKLYVKGLPKSATPESLRAVAERFGEVVSLRVVKDVHGQGKGYGFVRFLVAADGEAFEKAAAAGLVVLDACTLRVVPGHASGRRHARGASVSSTGSAGKSTHRRAPSRTLSSSHAQVDAAPRVVSARGAGPVPSKGDADAVNADALYCEVLAIPEYSSRASELTAALVGMYSPVRLRKFMAQPGALAGACAVAARHTQRRSGGYEGDSPTRLVRPGRVQHDRGAAPPAPAATLSGATRPERALRTHAPGPARTLAVPPPQAPPVATRDHTASPTAHPPSVGHPQRTSPRRHAHVQGLRRVLSDKGRQLLAAAAEAGIRSSPRQVHSMPAADGATLAAVAVAGDLGGGSGGGTTRRAGATATGAAAAHSSATRNRARALSGASASPTSLPAPSASPAHSPQLSGVDGLVEALAVDLLRLAGQRVTATQAASLERRLRDVVTAARTHTHTHMYTRV